MTKPSAILLLVITILLVVVLAVYLAPSKWQPDPPVVDEIGNLQTFKSEKYGYELQYPKNWVVDNTYSDSDTSLRGGGNITDEYMGSDTYWQNYNWQPDEPTDPPADHRSLSLLAHRGETNISIDEWSDSRYQSGEFSKLILERDFVTRVGVVGRQYVLESLDHPIGVQTMISVFKKGDVFYVFNSPILSENEHNEILATFKFF